MNMKDKRIQANKVLKWYDNNIRGLTWLYIFQYLFIPFSIIDYVYTIISSAIHGGYPILSYIICVFFLSCLIASWYCVSVLDKRGYYILQIYLIMSGLVYAYSFTTTLNVIYCIFIFINLLYMIYFFRRRDILKGVFFCLHAPDGSETIMRFDGVPTQDRSRSMKPKFCKYCGGAIDENKKCTGCGKQYFRMPKFSYRFLTYGIGMCVIILLTYEVCYYKSEYESEYQEKINLQAALNISNSKYESLEADYKTLENKYKNSENNIKSLSDRIKQYRHYKDAAIYWNQYGAITTSTSYGSLYHIYSCDKVQKANNLYVMTIWEAQDSGYVPCPDCLGK